MGCLFIFLMMPFKAQKFLSFGGFCFWLYHIVKSWIPNHWIPRDVLKWTILVRRFIPDSCYMGVMCYLMHRRITGSSSYYVHFTGGETEAWRSRITTWFTRRVGGDPGCRPCLSASLGDSYVSGSQRAPPSPLLSSLFSYFFFLLLNLAYSWNYWTFQLSYCIL